MKVIEKRAADGGLCAFAALSETYMDAQGNEMDTVAILTTGPTAEFAPIHDRMPVTLTPENFSRWLDCRSGETGSIADLLAPAIDTDLACVEVSPELNRAGREGPDLLVPPRPRLI